MTNHQAPPSSSPPRRFIDLRANWYSLTRCPDHNLKPVDGLRALSIILVFGFHVLWCAQLVIRDTYEQFLNLPTWVQVLKRGALGVELFFVISGFLIGRLLIQEFQRTGTLDLKRFYIRRFVRLMPAYWVALGLTAVGVLFTTYPLQVFERQISSNLDTIWANLLYVNNFLPANDQFFSHSWSLAVEEQFYLLCPLLLLFILRRQLTRFPVQVVAFLCASYFATRWYFQAETMDTIAAYCGGSTEHARDALLNANLQMMVSKYHACVAAVEFDTLYDNLYTRFFGFIAGIAAALCHVIGSERTEAFFKSSALRYPLALLALAAMCMPFVDHVAITDNETLYFVSRTLAYPLLDCGAAYWMMMMIHGGSTLEQRISRLFSHRWLYPIAQLSYSLYLFHILCIMGVYQALVAIHPEIQLPALMLIGGTLAWLISLPGAALVYLYVERPFVEARRRWAP